MLSYLTMIINIFRSDFQHGIEEEELIEPHLTKRPTFETQYFDKEP